MGQAVMAYKSVVASADFREIERQRDLTRLNETSALNNARRKGRTEGRAEGRQEGRNETLRKNVNHMCQEGFDVKTIARALGLSEQDVNDTLGI
ncbi:MAG: hypothetical protein LBB74_10640 [Chitinispirillales bacterium]|jgi:predicted transposase/invertase (TIGR01784 family)|nr:hypothetical protein [Chitinispirillales bacterium]